jgi:hypothetical protein
MKNFTYLLAFILNLTVSIPADAVRVPGLYEAEVPVQDQGQSSRQVAVTEAMKRVMVKLTGDRNAAGRYDLIPVIESAERYVQQYRYLEAESVNQDNSLNVTDQLILWVRFDEANLNNALRDLGVQVWGRERPSTLIWVAMEKDNSRRILQPDIEPEVFREIGNRAESRGIVLIYPLFDLQDNSSLRVSDIWGGFDYPVINASKRYNPDLVLSARVESPIPGIWEGFWNVYLGDGQQLSFTTQGSYPESVFIEGVDGVADIISDRFTHGVVAPLSQSVLKVIDIISVQQYAKVLNYLQSLSPVADVEVVQISPGNIEFNVSAHGGSQALDQAITFGGVLEPIGENMEIYRLIP